MEEGALWLAVQAAAVGSNNTCVKMGWILPCIRIVTWEKLSGVYTSRKELKTILLMDK
jgi:hypothetical protein